MGLVLFVWCLIGPEDGSIQAALVPDNTDESSNDAERLCAVLMDTGANPYNFSNHRMRYLSIKCGKCEECADEIQTGTQVTRVTEKITMSI